MKLMRIVGLLCAASIFVLPTGAAFAQEKTVKIGAVLSAKRQCCQRRRPRQSSDRGRDGHHQQRPSGARQFSARQERGPCRPRRRQGRGGFADNQGSPATGQNQALRLITEEKVVALTGAYQSGITLTTSAIAEKYGIPFINGESVAANLTERGFKWFFRVTPMASDIAKIYSDFLNDMKAAGTRPITSRSFMTTPNTACRLRTSSPAHSRRKAGHRARYRLRRSMPPTCRARCCNSRRRSPTS